MTERKRWLKLALVGALVVIADQASKLWAASALGSGPVVVSPAWFRFEYAENPGAAWNILSGAHASFRDPFLIVVGVCMMVFVLVYYARTKDGDRWNQLGLALVFGGGVGNFIDRMRLHRVIDFIVWHVGDSYYWPTFNVADAAICVGVVILAIASFARSGEPGQKTRT